MSTVQLRLVWSVWLWFVVGAELFNVRTADLLLLLELGVICVVRFVTWSRVTKFGLETKTGDWSWLLYVYWYVEGKTWIKIDCIDAMKEYGEAEV